jgi:hypothetical protein
LRQFDPIIASNPDSPLVHTYRGELKLWFGDIEGAEADFQLGIIKTAETALWAYIGLGATRMLQGRYEEALQLFQQSIDVSGIEGVTVFAYRGETHLRMGSLALAQSDLETAVAERPERIGAWIALALTYDAKNRPSEAASVWARLRDQAPGLMAEAAELCQLAPWASAEPQDRTDLVRILKRAHILLRGNRASALVSYFDRDDQIAFVPAKEAFDAQFRVNNLSQSRWILECSSGLRRPSYVLTTGCEPILLAKVAPLIPGQELAGGSFEGIQILKSKVIIRVVEADGAKTSVVLVHPSQIETEQQASGNALLRVEGSAGPVTHRLVDAIQKNQDVSLPWRRVEDARERKETKESEH